MHPILISAYNEPHRKYHDFKHIARMLSEFSCRNYIDIDYAFSHEEYMMVIDAILWHDAVYDVKSSTNEIDSAQLYAKTYLKEKDDLRTFDFMANVCDMIESTAYHFSNQNIALQSLERDDPIAAYLATIVLDLDLIGFTDDYDMFYETNEDIIKEYTSMFSLKEVLDGREKFFSNILKNKSLKFYNLDQSMTDKAYENINQYYKDCYNGY